MADTNPFDAASTDRVRQRVQGVADQSKYMLDTDLLKRTDQDIRNRLRHLPLLVVVFAKPVALPAALEQMSRSFLFMTMHGRVGLGVAHEQVDHERNADHAGEIIVEPDFVA